MNEKIKMLNDTVINHEFSQRKQNKTRSVRYRPYYQSYGDILTRSKKICPPADMFCWIVEESRKRSLGLPNEIDLADIRQAAQGVKNKWTNRPIPDWAKELLK